MYGVKLCLAPFVFLTDTFTGKFLCAFYCGGCHFLLNDVFVLDRICVPRWYDDVQPYMGLDIIL
jgi:hypothetical protein